MYVFIFLVKVTEWPPIGKIAAHSAYEMFSWCKYLIVSLVFSHLGFWSGNLFLIAPFPDLCLLVLFFQDCWMESTNLALIQGKWLSHRGFSVEIELYSIQNRSRTVTE